MPLLRFGSRANSAPIQTSKQLIIWKRLGRIFMPSAKSKWRDCVSRPCFIGASTSTAQNWSSWRRQSWSSKTWKTKKRKSRNWENIWRWESGCWSRSDEWCGWEDYWERGLRSHLFATMTWKSEFWLNVFLNCSPLIELRFEKFFWTMKRWKQTIIWSN